MKNLTVSAIIPVFNGARFLSDAVHSIEVQQPHVLEIIVVDDGSTDETSRIAKSLGERITYVRQENQGPATARNRGLQEASGNVIAFLDVDDCWRPDKLAIQLPLLEADRTCDAVWGMTQVLMLSTSDNDGDSFRESGPPQYYPQFGSFLFHSRLLEQLGGLDTQHSHADDIDLIARAEESGARLMQHSDVVLDWRRHQANITNDVAQSRKDFVAVIKRSLDRKRKLSQEN